MVLIKGCGLDVCRYYLQVNLTFNVGSNEVSFCICDTLKTKGLN